MLGSPTRRRWCAAVTAGLVFAQLTLWALSPEAGAAEENNSHSAQPDGGDSARSAPETEGIWPRVPSNDLPKESDGEEEIADIRFAQYFAQPPNEAGRAEEVRQPFFLVEDATDENGFNKADEKSNNDSKPQDAAGTSARSNGQNEAQISRGRGYFESSCTQCHDAERATSKRKSYSAWLATVRRMAAKEDANIPASEYEDIAAYLASLNPANGAAANGAGANGEGASAAAEVAEQPFTLNGTISPVYRGTDPEVENKGFFPDVWVGVEWRPRNSPVSGKVTVCASCHGTNNGLGVELVEAAAILDLCHLLTRTPPEERPCSRMQAELTMGRFIVPFGAFSGRVHPGALRTVSLPLMYNMGRRVGPIGPGQPVINQPYSDEGANLHLEYELRHDWDVTFDTYAVNGLQFGGPGVFFFSRSYQDNNSNLAVGGRATTGNERWRFGGSIAGGELQDDAAPLEAYSLAGGDVTYRHGEFFRAYYEYAIRQEDSFPNSEIIAYGNLIESEILLLKDPKISFLARYDTLEHRGRFGNESTERFTYGLNWVLRGGSLLILNHEHWIYDNRSPANIFGLRWTTVF